MRMYERTSFSIELRERDESMSMDMKGPVYSLEEIYEGYVEAYELARSGRGAYDPEVEAASDPGSYTYERAAYVKSILLGNMLIDFDSLRDVSGDLTIEEFVSSWTRYVIYLENRLVGIEKRIDAGLATDDRVLLRRALNEKEDIVIETRMIESLLEAMSNVVD